MLPSIFGETPFDELFGRSFVEDFFAPHRREGGYPARNLMKTDVKEVQGGYEMDVELPGCRKEDVNLDLRDGYLTIRAVRNGSHDEKDDNGRFIRQERYSGSCSRSFYVGDIQPGEVSARFEDGILRLTLPQRDARQIEQPSRIAIE